MMAKFMPLVKVGLPLFSTTWNKMKHSHTMQIPVLQNSKPNGAIMN